MILHVDPQKRKRRRLSLRGGSDSSLLVGVPTTPSKAALAQCKCQLQPIETSMFMGVEADEELVNLRVS